MARRRAAGGRRCRVATSTRRRGRRRRRAARGRRSGWRCSPRGRRRSPRARRVGAGPRRSADDRWQGGPPPRSALGRPGGCAARDRLTCRQGMRGRTAPRVCRAPARHVPAAGRGAGRRSAARRAQRRAGRCCPAGSCARRPHPNAGASRLRPPDTAPTMPTDRPSRRTRRSEPISGSGSCAGWASTSWSQPSTRTRVVGRRGVGTDERPVAGAAPRRRSTSSRRCRTRAAQARWSSVRALVPRWGRAPRSASDPCASMTCRCRASGPDLAAAASASARRAVVRPLPDPPGEQPGTAGGVPGERRDALQLWFVDEPHARRERRSTGRRPPPRAGTERGDGSGAARARGGRPPSRR